MGVPGNCFRHERERQSDVCVMKYILTDCMGQVQCNSDGTTECCGSGIVLTPPLHMFMMIFNQNIMFYIISTG